MFSRVLRRYLSLHQLRNKYVTWSLGLGRGWVRINNFIVRWERLKAKS